MPALTIANVLAVLVLSFVAGFGWSVGCRLCAAVFK
jgi:hypothetical protein